MVTLYADATGLLIGMQYQAEDGASSPPPDGTTSTLTFDERTNLGLWLDIEDHQAAYRLMGAQLSKDGQPVSINPPGPEMLQQTEARDYQTQLDAAITFLQSGIDAWSTMTANQKQAWLAANFDKVLKIELGLLRMVRWAARKLGLGA